MPATLPTPRLRWHLRWRGAAPRSSRSRQRSARAVVAWGVALVVLANVAILVSLEAFWPNARDPEYGYRLDRVRAHQRAHPDRPLVVAFGTSRTQNAFDPRSMAFPDEPGSPLVFNFGQGGAPPLLQWLTHQRLLATDVRPEAVLVELCPLTLHLSGPAEVLFAPNTECLSAADVRRLEPYCGDPDALRRRWAAERPRVWRAQQSMMLSHIAPEWQPWERRVDHYWDDTRASGFAPYSAPVTDGERTRLRESVGVAYFATLQQLRVAEFTKRAYRDLVTECRARGVPVAFYLAPESPAFRSWYSPASREVLAAYCRELSAEFGTPVFGALDTMTEEDFADGHHMLPGGAAKYSRWLADTHLRPWLTSAVRGPSSSR